MHRSDAATIFLTNESATLRHGHRASDLLSVPLEPPSVRPFLKWTGGKQWLARLLPEIEPEQFTGRYYEPFLGGGCAFFSIEPSYAILSDINKELIATYSAVKTDVESVISHLRSLQNDRNEYQRIRESKPKSSIEIAARFIYLNKTAFNGMYRVNRSGQFNVPFGRYTNPTICNAERLREAHIALRCCRLRCCDFATATADADPYDLVYFDPPYITGHTNNGFLKYNAPLFSWPDQERLAHVARVLARNGTHVIVSHAPFRPVISLYRGFYYYQLDRNSLISGNGATRGRVTEVLLSSFPLFDIEVDRI